MIIRSISFEYLMWYNAGIEKSTNIKGGVIMAVKINSVMKMYGVRHFDLAALKSVYDFGMRCEKDKIEELNSVDRWFIINAGYAHDLYTVKKAYNAVKKVHPIDEIMLCASSLAYADINRSVFKQVDKQILVKKVAAGK